MNGKFNVWDSKLKIWINDKRFFLDNCGILYYNDYDDHHDYIIKADDRFIHVFSTGKTDKNGVELFEGDRMRNKNGHEFTLKNAIEGLGTCEKIGSKYEEN